MQDMQLIKLLEAGCHFGHKKEKWHPKAASFIYQTRDGIHIIDLAKTRAALMKAAEFAKELGLQGKNILFVGTKRQAKGVVSEAAKRANLPYLTNRWIGGFMTNWEMVKKNVEKFNRMHREQFDGTWKKFPKHEIVQLEKELRKLDMVYTGVAQLTAKPDAVFIVDIKREIAAVRESARMEIPLLAVVDTNGDPNSVDYPIPANDDAVGSIQCIVDYVVEAYIEGKKIYEKNQDREAVKKQKDEEAEKARIAAGEKEAMKPKATVKPEIKKDKKKEEVAKPKVQPKPEVKKEKAKKLPKQPK